MTITQKSKLILLKIFLFIVFVSLFAYFYKKEIEKEDPSSNWKDAFYISTLNQTLTGIPNTIESIKTIVIIQNIIAYIILIGGLYLLLR